MWRFLAPPRHPPRPAAASAGLARFWEARRPFSPGLGSSAVPAAGLRPRPRPARPLLAAAPPSRPRGQRDPVSGRGPDPRHPRPTAPQLRLPYLEGREVGREEGGGRQLREKNVGLRGAGRRGRGGPEGGGVWISLQSPFPSLRGWGAAAPGCGPSRRILGLQRERQTLP